MRQMRGQVRVAGLAGQWCGALGLRVALLAITLG